MVRIIDARRAGRANRTGFTLLELLVILGIIAILVALTASAAFRILVAQKKSTTLLLINRVNSRYQQISAEKMDQARNEAILSLVTSFPSVPAPIDLSLGDSNRARVIHMKLRMRQWFPTSFADVFNPVNGNLPQISGYVNYLAQYGITAANFAGEVPTPPTPNYQSAACLYMILRYGANGISDDELGASAIQSFGVQPGVSIPALVDAWGNPLLFCRWPTGDLLAGGAGGTGISPVNPSGALAANPPPPGFQDPLDPTGTLAKTKWLNSTSRTAFELPGVGHPVVNRVGGKAVSLNLAPVIASSGPDGQLGVDPTTLLFLTPTQANDNLYNR